VRPRRARGEDEADENQQRFHDAEHTGADDAFANWPCGRCLDAFRVDWQIPGLWQDLTGAPFHDWPIAEWLQIDSRLLPAARAVEAGRRNRDRHDESIGAA
jgi:hypothetical protein